MPMESPISTKALADMIAALEGTIQEHMSQNDASHDWAHIQRVRNSARQLSLAEGLSAADTLVVDLAALLHDVEDWKYAQSSKKLHVKVWNTYSHCCLIRDGKCASHTLVAISTHVWP
jgi:HD superfamily phosphodiesterase